MKEERYFYAPEALTLDELPADEAVHAVRVLRLKPGDELMLMDGRGTFFRAEVTEATQKRCQYAIVEELPQERQWAGRIHLAIAPTKLMERMEWLVEKATEIGIDELSFLCCQFSERQSLKLPRLEKIAVSAMKQSRKAWLPVLNEMQGFSKFVERHSTGRRYIAHCYAETERVPLFEELQKGSPDEDALVPDEAAVSDAFVVSAAFVRSAAFVLSVAFVRSAAFVVSAASVVSAFVVSAVFAISAAGFSGPSGAASATVSRTVRTTESSSASIRCFILRPPSRNPSRKARTTSSSTMPASISSEILRVLLLGEYMSASLHYLICGAQKRLILSITANCEKVDIKMTVFRCFSFNFILLLIKYSH